MAGGSDNKKTAARTRSMRARNSRYIRILVSIIIVVVAFFAGFFVRGDTALLTSLGLPESITGQSEKTDGTSLSSTSSNSLSVRVAEVESILTEDSLDTYDVETATTDMLNAFSEATDDPYLKYYTQSRYEALSTSSETSYAGVGVLFSEYNGQAYAVDVYEGSEAQLKGVQEGDFVVSINGDASQTWSRNEVAAALAQNEGKSVVITWRRPESLESTGGEEFTTTLEVKQYDEVNVTTEINNGVGYIKVRQFTQNTSSLVSQAVTEMEAQGVTAYILDLRDNPGGYLTQAVNVASVFMSSGNVVEIRTKDGQSVKAATGNSLTNKPLIVIANKNTAAAAEVVVAALKESQRATVVGTTTLGKGSVQVIRELSFGGALRYTAAYYLTPQGHAINNVGVTPNVSIENTGTTDSQLDYAYEVAYSSGQE